MLNTTLRITTLALLCLAAGAADLGETAAPLEIDAWLKGDAITLESARNKNILVVEFWATWCPPCRTSIPHLTDVQKKFQDKGVVIIGVTNEPASVSGPFVEKQGDKMAYRVAVDKENKTTQGYMQKYRIPGIPHAFIVDRAGKIAWHGHPMDGLEAAIEKTLGSDSKSKQDRLAELMTAYEERAADSAQADGARAAVSDFLNLCESDAALMTTFANRVLDRPGAAAIDHECAARLARAAVKATKGANPEACEAFARAWAATGNRERALRYQQMAIRLTDAAAADLRAAREARLKAYEALPESMTKPTEPAQP
jgi:thiol-disulfide isomerase/thioredoxin